MSSPPENPFSSADSDNNRFDAFQLSPEKTSDTKSSLPSLQSIQAAQQQQQQMQQQQQQQQRAVSSSSQQSQSLNLPSPDELQGPINSTTTTNNNDWIPPPSSSSTGILPPNNNINNYNTNNIDSQSFLPKFLTCGGALSIESLRPYFDVDTADLVVRMKSSMKYCNVPDGFRNEVLYSDNAMRLAYRRDTTRGGEGGGEGGGGGSGSGEGGEVVTSVGTVGGGEGKGPDLYGPTWITMTLVFLLAVTSNMSLYFHHTGSVVDEGGIAAEEEWDYDINQLLHATWILYSFSFLLPMVLYLIFRLMGIMSFSMVDLICLYGYSLVPYFPTTWICVAPVSWLQWLSLCLSTVISGMLVLRNVTGPILESAGGGGSGGGMGQGKTGGLIMAVIGCHFIFFLVMKLAFYHHVHAV